jgi:2-iminobutanoate/2-iminopropanoate deaminase
MSKQILTAPAAPPSFAGYSHGVKANGMIYVSGQGPFDTAGTLVGDTIQEQTRQCLTNVQHILAAGGATMADVVQATFILAEESDFAGMNEEWGRWFPNDPPARQGAMLPIRSMGMRISIAAIAVVAAG